MDNKQKIMQFIFEDPGREFHIRLLARLTKLNPNTVINISEQLVDDGLIIKQKKKDSNMVIIKADERNPIYKIKKQFYNVEKIQKSGLIEFLNEQLDHPTMILFGSHAKAENRPNSDIDVFILTANKKNINLKKYEALLKAEIQLFIYTKQEFEALKDKNPELVNNIINGYKLAGYLEAI